VPRDLRAVIARSRKNEVDGRAGSPGTKRTGAANALRCIELRKDAIRVLVEVLGDLKKELGEWYKGRRVSRQLNPFIAETESTDEVI
jgi:hypothetical protein